MKNPAFEKDERVRARKVIRDVDDRLDRLVRVAHPGDLGTVVHVTEGKFPCVHVWFDGREDAVGVSPKFLERAE